MEIYYLLYFYHKHIPGLVSGIVTYAWSITPGVRDTIDWYVLYEHKPFDNGPLTRYAKLQVAHAPGMPGTFSSAADFDRNRYLAIPTCITARAWRTCRDACRDRLPAVTGKKLRAFPAHVHPQFCVSGKRPIGTLQVADLWVLLDTDH